MIEFFKSNYQWLFGGIGVTAIFYIIDKFFFKKESKTRKTKKNQNKNSIIITNNLTSNPSEQKQEKVNEINEPKNNVRILFVDDEHTKYKMVSILKKSRLEKYKFG